MTDLATRIEQAGGPDRELDLEILSSLGTHVLEKRMRDKKAWWYKIGGRQYERLNADTYAREIPRYTASIDAAMTLVPEGLVWSVMTDFELPGRARLWGSVMPGQVQDRGWSADAATPALALSAAALRAREAKP